MLHGCQTGDAKITRGVRLPARLVIHAVGPVWQAAAAAIDGAGVVLRPCHIELCQKHGLASVAFPSDFHRHLSLSRGSSGADRGRSNSERACRGARR